MSNLQYVAISEIKESPVALRSVDTQGESFLGLVDSIRQQGVMNPITVREEEVEGGQKVKILVDGLHRFTAAKEAGLDKIPCHILDLDKAEVLTAQIIANVHKVETKPVEYTKQIFKILSASPVLTITELASQLAKSPQWLRERLGLLKLIERAQTLVDEEKISLSNAYSLSKLPPEEQANWIDRAMTQTPQEFLPAVNSRVKEIKKARREGRDPAAAEDFVAVARLRKVKDIKEEMEVGKIGAQLCADSKITSPAAGFNLGIKWVLHLDEQSIATAKAKDAERKLLREQASEERKAERLAKKAREAAVEADKAKSELKFT